MENVAVCIILYIVLNTGLFVAANFMTNFTMTTLSGILFPIDLIYRNAHFSMIDYIALAIIISVMHIALYKIANDRYSFAFLVLFLIVSLVTTVTYTSPI